MAIRRQNNSWGNRILSKFGEWFESETKNRHGSIDLTAFLSISAIILTLSAFLYLGDYYSNFDINYFRFFTFEDGLNVLYEKGRLLILFPMILGFAAIALTLLHIIIKKDIHKVLKKNSIFLFAIISTGAFTYQIFRTVGNLPLNASIVIGGFAAAIMVMYFLFDVRTLYFFPLLLGFGLMLCAGPDVRKTVTEKLKYNLVMIDGSPAIPLDQKKRTFWIGSTSKIIFLYNDSLREVTEISIDQIKKINYVRPNEAKANYKK
ncbi:hypothetical protein QG516_03545 [Pedobacter gandavensis]|uniref:hypothetical protein n=1 Tax=Pedobacter gandavensis TaxID=2679963 RepID=UPI0024798A78|nr:hypothetical protein [Pedobacter gandavensis]WGQ10729.1 hypothetical protein QG516_03545 [Pedobacter gandavensis]